MLRTRSLACSIKADGLRGAGAVAASGTRTFAYWPLYVANQLSLGAGVSVYISLGRLDGPVAREQLDVAQAAAGSMDVARRNSNEAASPGM
jgi:hypothetical protein